MNRIISSYLNQFSVEHSILDMKESDQFERFVNYCLVSQFHLDSFEVDSITTSSSDDGIDGVAVLMDDQLITTAEDARNAFAGLPRRKSVEVQYIFVQTKSSENFDLGQMLKLGAGVASLLTNAKKPIDDVLAEFRDIHDLVVKNLSSVNNGRPTCTMYYACTGTWNKTNGLQERAITPCETQVAATRYFHAVSYLPIDNDAIINLWVRTRAPVQATFPVKSQVSFPIINGVTQAYLVLAPAQEFINHVLADSDGRLRSSVFEQNVRSFLGDENSVNRRMKDALQDRDVHDRFAINNNGITIVASEVKYQNDRIYISDYQIVNGCQTSHTLFRNQSVLSEKVWIPVKVIEANAPDVVSQLVESTNSQTDVAETQFLSIRPSVQRIEAYFDSFENTEEDKERRLYFERRTNQYAGFNLGKARVFDIPKLARCVAAMFFDMPHIAYMYPTQVLKERGALLYQSEHRERMYYTAALALYRLELSLGNRYVPREHQSLKWHMLMLVRYLIAGPEMPRLESPKIDKYCDAIDEALTKGGKAAAPPFVEAGKIIDRVGPVTRDRRKGQPYTDELKDLAKKAFKRSQAKLDSGRT